jgi:hypothetical protein
MKFELAFEALRHGYCITVQENKALWYRWDQTLECIRSYIHNMHQCYSLDIPIDRIMTDRWQVGVFIEGNSPLWLDIPDAYDIEQIMQYAEIALEEREQRLAGTL